MSDQLVSASAADDFPATVCSGGGPYALAVAHYLPDRVRGVLLISPASDYGELAFHVSLARKHGANGVKEAFFLLCLCHSGRQSQKCQQQYAQFCAF